MKNLYIYKNIYKMRFFRLQTLNYIELDSDASYSLQCQNINYINIKFISYAILYLFFIFIIILKIIFYKYINNFIFIYYIFYINEVTNLKVNIGLLIYNLN